MLPFVNRCYVYRYDKNIVVVAGEVVGWSFDLD